MRTRTESKEKGQTVGRVTLQTAAMTCQMHKEYFRSKLKFWENVFVLTSLTC